MPTQIGPLTKFSWRREALIYGPSWPPTTIATTDLLPLISDTTYDLRTTVPYAGAGIEIGAATQDITAKPIASTVELAAYYAGLDGLIAATMGHEALRITSTTMPESLGSGVYRHIYEFDPWHDGPWRADDGFLMDQGILMDQHKPCRGTMAIDKQVAIWEFNGMAVNTWEWSSSSGGMANVRLGMIGYQLTEPASVNTSMANHATLVAPAMLHQQLDFALGAFSTSTALNSGNTIGTTEFNVSIDNHLGFNYGPLTQLSAGEIQRTTAPTVSVQFTVPRYATDAVLNWHRNQTLLMGYAKYAGGTIPSSATAYAFRYYFPSCRITELTYSTQASVPQLEATLALFVPTAEAAGFPLVNHVERQLYVETIGQVAANQLV
jgi:hypothetical protein